MNVEILPLSNEHGARFDCQIGNSLLCYVIWGPKIAAKTHV